MSNKHKTLNHELAITAQLAEVTDDGFKDVSIMTVGPARGHGLRVDEKTVGQFMTMVLGKSMPAYLTHKGASDDEGVPQDRLGQEIGMFSGFYRDGSQIRARNFKFLDSWKAANTERYAKLMELAKSFPDQLGISPVVAYVKSWVTKEGTEVVDNGQSVPANLLDETPAMRIRKIFSLDFVKSPATNTGLFDDMIEAEDNNPQPEDSMSKELESKIATLTEQLNTKTGELSSLQTAHNTKVSELTTAHTAALAARDATITTLTSEKKTATDKVAELERKITAVEAQRDDAVKHDIRLAGAPALTIALQSKDGGLPEPKENINERWEQYVGLCEEVKATDGRLIGHKDTEKSLRFRAKYLGTGK